MCAILRNRSLGRRRPTCRCCRGQRRHIVSALAQTIRHSNLTSPHHRTQATLSVVGNVQIHLTRKSNVNQFDNQLRYLYQLPITSAIIERWSFSHRVHCQHIIVFLLRCTRGTEAGALKVKLVPEILLCL